MPNNSERRVIWIAGFALALTLFVIIGICVPYKVEKSWFCPYCRASKAQTVLFGMHLAPVLYEDQASRYWMKAIDPKHQHVWVLSDEEELYFCGRSCGCGYNDAERRMLSPEAEIAILQSLGPAKQRKHLIDHLLVWDCNKPESIVEWRVQAFQQLAAAYEQNPNRKDWPNQLEKLGIRK